MNLDHFIERLSLTARNDKQTIWYPVASAEEIEFAECELGFPLPEILKRCYTQISNGGFGPGDPLIGLPGGHNSSWGDLLQSHQVLQQDEEYEDGWLPLFDWGCNEFLIVDCYDEHIVTLYEGMFDDEDYTLADLFTHWINGEIPDLRTGNFYQP